MVRRMIMMNEALGVRFWLAKPMGANIGIIATMGDLYPVGQ